MAARWDRGRFLGVGRPHAREAGVRKAAALVAVSLVSVARWPGAAWDGRDAAMSAEC